MSLAADMLDGTKDKVYTPAWVAKDMVDTFRPRGVVMDPCRGFGAFDPYLPPGYLWCEIEEGRDFYKWTGRVDWLFGNPPYSQFAEWMQHSLLLAPEIGYLLPANKPFLGDTFLRRLAWWGGMRTMRVYGPGRALGYPFGFAMAAIHFSRGYKGPMQMTFYRGDKDA